MKKAEKILSALSAICGFMSDTTHTQSHIFRAKISNK